MYSTLKFNSPQIDSVLRSPPAIVMMGIALLQIGECQSIDAADYDDDDDDAGPPTRESGDLTLHTPSLALFCIGGGRWHQYGTL